MAQLEDEVTGYSIHILPILAVIRATLMLPHCPALLSPCGVALLKGKGKGEHLL